MSKIFCKELDKHFDTKELMFKELFENRNEIIAIKKANIYKSIDKGSIAPLQILKNIDAVKAPFEIDENYFYAVINSTNYLDSHGDVHIPELWKKSLKDNVGKLHYVVDHELKVASVIAWPKDVEAFTIIVPWSFIGKDYAGDTQILVYKIPKSAIMMPEVKYVIDNKIDVQNSVRMQYITIKFCVNSDDKDYAEAKNNWNNYIDQVANKDVALSDGYFFAILEAAIRQEGSMVIYGSNDATPIIFESKNNEPEAVADTSKIIEPSDDTQTIPMPKMDYKAMAQTITINLKNK
jgi:hypothetical protein